MNYDVDRKVLMWFEHVERMSGELMTEGVDESEVEERWNRGRLCTGWRDGVKKSVQCENTVPQSCESDVHGYRVVAELCK